MKSCLINHDNNSFVIMVWMSDKGLYITTEHIEAIHIWDVTYSDHYKYNHETNHFYLDTLNQLVSQKFQDFKT